MADEGVERTPHVRNDSDHEIFLLSVQLLLSEFVVVVVLMPMTYVGVMGVTFKKRAGTKKRRRLYFVSRLWSEWADVPPC